MHLSKIKIAITGKPGVGKSKLLHLLANKGYTIFDCDEYVHFLYIKDNLGYEFIKNRFGKEYVYPNEVNLEKLRSKIIEDKNVLTEIENFLYPEIKKHIIKNKYDIVEIAKMKNNEVDFTNLFDLIFNITRNENERIQFLKSRVVSNDQYELLMGINSNDRESKYVNIYVYNISEALQIIENKLSQFKKI